MSKNKLKRNIAVNFKKVYGLNGKIALKKWLEETLSKNDLKLRAMQLRAASTRV